MAVQGYYSMDRCEVLPFIPAEYSRVLEVGCGEGVFLKHLKPNCEIWGIDPNSDVCEVASSRGYKCFVGTYDSVCMHLPDNYFDLVICNDVIEHMHDHEKFFEEIKTKLKIRGHIIGSIPNIRYFPIVTDLIFNCNWKYKDFGVLDKTHLRFFTKKSLLNIFKSHDYTVKMFYGINEFRLRRISHFLLYGIMQIITLFRFCDCKYMQFGFQIQKTK